MSSHWRGLLDCVRCLGKSRRRLAALLCIQALIVVLIKTGLPATCNSRDERDDYPGYWMDLHVVPDTNQLQEAVLSDSFWTLCQPRAYSFQYRSNPSEFCKRNSPVTMLMLVPSNPGNTKYRHRLRHTWGKRLEYNNHSIEFMFLIGQPGDGPNGKRLQDSIDAENAFHRDIIQGDFLDSYRNLTYKMLMGLDWATTYCPQAEYIFRVDDDVSEYPLRLLVDYLNTALGSNTSSVMCMLMEPVKQVHGHVPVHRDPASKWHVTYSEYPEDAYPDYCPGGPGYAMSLSTASKLLQEAYRTRFFWVDDVLITGVLRAKLRIPATQISFV